MRIDAHVHIVGNGKSGSGCWIKVRKLYHRFLARQMLTGMQLPCQIDDPDFDTLYIARLQEMLATASLDALMILAHDHVYDSQGRKQEFRSSFYVPNDYVLRLAQENPGFLPAVSIHPARPDALDELERCIAAGAKMMKCLPNCHNINCSNPSFRPFWERLAQAGLPLLAHTGGELSVPVIQRAYANPQILRLPLECGVRVIAAHCGTDSHPFDPDYSETLEALFQEFPHLYCDNSALNTPFRSRHFRKTLRSPFVDRMVHGSDLPIPVSARWVAWRGLISQSAYQQIRQVENSLQADVAIKQALGFPEEVFTRLSQLLPIKA